MRWEGKGKSLAVVEARGGGDEGRCQERWSGTEVVEAEGRNGVHDACAEAGKRGVEDAVAGANAALAAGSEDLAPEALIELRRVGEADARCEVFIAGGSDGSGNAGIAGDEESLRRAGVESGLCSGDVGLKLVVFFPPRRDDVPAEASVDGEVAARSPTVLDVEAEIAIAQVEGLAGGLGEVAGGADEEVGVGVAGFGAVDVEGAVERGVGMLVDLVDVELAAELERVRADGRGRGHR